MLDSVNEGLRDNDSVDIATPSVAQSGHDGFVSRRLMAQVAVAIVAVVAACGDDGSGVATKEDALASVVSTTLERTGWCDEYSALLKSDDPTGGAIAGAPDEIGTQLKVLAEAADIDPEAAPTGTSARLLKAFAVVESWGHENCGGHHPFCSLWTTLSGTIAASAFSDADEEDIAVELGSFVDELDDVLIEYAPPEMLTHLRTLLDWIRLTSTTSDAGERAAEVAVDELDQWAWSEGCEGASQPVADE